MIFGFEVRVWDFVKWKREEFFIVEDFGMIIFLCNVEVFVEVISMGN